MSKLTLAYPLLCLITDPEVPDLVTRVEAALSAGVNMLQLRGHSLPATELYRLALALRPLCRHYQALLIVNDRIDVGLAARADGFQLGIRSLPLATARQLVGEDYLLGASVHSPEEALAAWTNGADFLLAGTIFASHTHPGEQPSGIDLLHAITAKLSTPSVGTGASPVPTEKVAILAIGGITSRNARQVMEAGADGIAVISAILNATNIKEAVSELRTAINPKESRETP